MTTTSKITIAFTVLSTALLYIETMLQIYVSVTSNSSSLLDSTPAIVTMCLVLVSYVLTSIASAVRAHSTNVVGGHQFSETTVFILFHLFFVGFIWRIFKFVVFHSKHNAKDFAIIRLIHVALQSSPFFVIYSSIFIKDRHIGIMQALSLIVSILSIVLAVTQYHLRLHFIKEDAMASDESAGPDNEKTVIMNSRVCFAIFSIYVGTFFVLSSRLVSMAMMASQEPFWMFLPLGCHFLILCVIFIGFSSRSKSKSHALPKDVAIHVLWGVFMSILHCYDLIRDNVARVMCKYVGFFTVILIENIVFLSFWLLRYDLEYIPKLISVVFILTAFIFGLVIRFSGLNMLSDPKIGQKTDNTLSKTVVLTISNISASVPQTNPKNHYDDFVSIVQASLNRRHSEFEANTNTRSTRRNKKEMDNGVEDQQIRSNGRNVGAHLQYDAQRHQGLLRDNSGISQHKNESLPKKKTFRNHTGVDSVDLDTSLQPGSMFNVSDPGTIRSDMMYDDGENAGGVGGSGFDGNEHRRETLEVKALHQKPPYKSDKKYDRYVREISIHPGSTYDGQQFSIPLSKRSKAFEQLGIMDNDISIHSASFRNRHVNGHLSNNTSDDNANSSRNANNNSEVLPSNELSDAAVSSAKTYPIESKKVDLKAYDTASMYQSSLGRQMNKIIYSLEEDGRTSKSSTLEHRTRNGPNSDDDIYRYKSNTIRSFHSVRNRISYTDPEGDISTSENAVSSSRDDTSKGKKLSDLKSNSTKYRKPVVHANKPFPHSTATVASVPPKSPSFPKTTIQLCESESSSFTTLTQENNTFTKTSTSASSSSSSSSMSAKQFYWGDPEGTLKRYVS